LLIKWFGKIDSLSETKHGVERQRDELEQSTHLDIKREREIKELEKVESEEQTPTTSVCLKGK